MAVPRAVKLNAEFQKSIYEILTRKVKNPDLTEMFSILSVETDKELATAKVYISIFSTDKQKSELTLKAIKDSAGFVRQQLSKSMHIRTVPALTFLIDDTMNYSDRINKILKEIKTGEDGKDIKCD